MWNLQTTVTADLYLVDTPLLEHHTSRPCLEPRNSFQWHDSAHVDALPALNLLQSSSRPQCFAADGSIHYTKPEIATHVASWNSECIPLSDNGYKARELPAGEVPVYGTLFSSHGIQR